MCPAKVTVSCKAQEPHRGRSFLTWSWTMSNDLRRQKLMCVETSFTYIHRNIWCWVGLETTVISSTLGNGTLFSIVYWGYLQFSCPYLQEGEPWQKQLLCLLANEISVTQNIVITWCARTWGSTNKDFCVGHLGVVSSVRTTLFPSFSPKKEISVF